MYLVVRIVRPSPARGPSLRLDRVFHLALDAPQFGEELPEHPPVRLSAIEIHQFAFAAFVNARIEDDALDGVLPRRIVALFDQTQQTAPILSAAVRVHDVLHPRIEVQQVFHGCSTAGRCIGPYLRSNSNPSKKYAG